jgi:hypothetical protein
VQLAGAFGDGFLPVLLDGRETGFELAIGDDGASISCRGSRERRAGRIFARALAMMTGGSWSDPQTDDGEDFGAR